MKVFPFFCPNQFIDDLKLLAGMHIISNDPVLLFIQQGI